VSARDWVSLGNVLSSPGVFGEVLHLYFATQIEPSTAAHEHSEVIEVHWIPFEEAFTWAMEGTIRDAKTVIGLARAYALGAVPKRPTADIP
jgi:ADP-ribose pyrophosphatase